MKTRHVYIVLGLLTLSLGYVVASAIQDTRQEVFISVAKNKLKQLSLGFHNYEYLKQKSVFNDAVERNMSWRVLLSETFADDFLEGNSNDILNQPTPEHLRNPRMSGIFRGFSETDSSTLTSFRAIHMKAGYEDVKDKVSEWVVAFLPANREQWTSQETLSEEDFKKLLSRQDESKAPPVFIVTEAGKVIKAEQFMTEFRSLK